MRILKLSIAALLILSSFASAAGPFNYSERWNGWSLATRHAYLDGLRDGIHSGMDQFYISYAGTNRIDLESEEGKRVQKASKETVLYFENDPLIKVIDALYKEPANSFIACREIAVLARDKLKGKSIEESLAKARKMAILVHEINEKEKDR